MKMSIPWIAATTLAIAAAARADEPMRMGPHGQPQAAGQPGQPGRSEPLFLNAKDIQWTEGLPVFPKGMQMSIIHGDPAKAGLFAVRLKMPDGYKIPPHWHTQDEQLTILDGTLVMHMGDSMKSEAHGLETGGYHFLPGKMHHSAEAKGETIVQVQGMGPFDIHYVNPADNPSPKAASK